MTKRDVVNMAAIVAFTFGLFGGLLKIIPDDLSIILVIPATVMWAAGEVRPMTDARETALTEFTRDSMSIRYPTFISRDDAQTLFDKAVAALTSAGFRILGPDEIDGQTVEKCAEVADEYATRKDILHSSIHFHVCANRLRALKT